jgi:hypothetical protein
MKAIAIASVLGAAGVIGLGGIGTSANAAILADYEFGTVVGDVATPSYASTDLDLNSTATDFFSADGLGGTGNYPNATNGIKTDEGSPAPEYYQKPITGGNGVDTDPVAAGTQDPGTRETAVGADAYWSFTLTPGSGFTVNLTSLTFDLGVKNGGSRPISYSLSTSVGGFSTPVGPVVTAQATSNQPTYDLSGTEFQNLTSPVELRLYLWSDAGGSSSSRWTFDNIELEGTTTSTVPEPASLTLLSAAGLVALRRRRGANACRR